MGRPAAHPSSPYARWAPWLVGGFALALVIAAALHFSDGRELLALASRAHPGWLMLAAVLQVGTYACEAELWRGITCRAGCRLTFLQGLQLSVGKMFIDGALPTGGVSGSIMASSALNKRGVTKSLAAAAVIVERVSFLVAYAVALGLAVVLWIGMRGSGSVVLAGGIGFAGVAALVAFAMLSFAGSEKELPRWAARLRPMRALLTWLREGDRRIVRNPKVVAYAVALQAAVIALDASTMLVVVRSLGAHLDLGGVFVSFMVSSLFRTLGVVPGGLGTFEASSTMTLRMAGADLPVAISATMLFRGLSYWLPLVPGVWFARRMTRTAPASRETDPRRRHAAELT